MTSFQIVVECANPDPLARFWAAALGYVLEHAPDGYDGWHAYWRAVGVPEDELLDRRPGPLRRRDARPRRQRVLRQLVGGTGPPP